MELNAFGIAGVACITVICYLAALGVKQTPLANKWLPTICGALGAVLGPVSLLVVTCSGVLLSAFRGGYLQRRFWPVMLCAWAGVLLHQGLMFSLGLFLGSTAAGRWMEALGGGLGTCLACCALYPLVLALGKIGGETWKE